jgi:hypothetical protein
MERRRSITKVELVVGTQAMTLLALLAMVACEPKVQERGLITKGISNCRQIITSLRIYSSDHNGKYPDAFLKDKRTANAAFRILFEEQCIDNEMIFGCPVSPLVPDGKIEDTYIGNNGKYGDALEPGENHWMLTAGLTDASPGAIPLVYENALTATWSPKWNADKVGKEVRGRAWTTGIIIGMNDSSVSIQPLAAKSGKAVGLKPDSITGKDYFEAAIDPKVFPKGEVLDIE